MSEFEQRNYPNMSMEEMHQAMALESGTPTAPESPTTQISGSNLTRKLCQVMAAVGYTQKTGWNEAQKYHYVTEADISEKVRPELAKRNIFIFPSVLTNTRTKIERKSFDKYEKDPDKAWRVKESYATDIIMRWTIVDGDTGEERICDIPGCSESPGDKGVYVAMTGSQKYLLVKSLFLPTGDDPEADANEPVGTKESSTEAKRQAAKAVGDAKVAESCLFYTWHDASQSAEISGPESLKTANKDLLKPLWNANARAIVVNADQLEALKYELEQRKVLFRALKEAK